MTVGTALLANLSPRATVLSPDRQQVVTFDREGRWIYYFRRGETFKRSLASEVHWRFRQGVRLRRRLPDPEARELFGEIHELTRELTESYSGPALGRLRDEIIRWDPESLMREADRFRAAYRPIAILPPDQYLAVVLQATEGCSWNKCTFCNFYMDRPFRSRIPDDFRAHSEAVRQLLGRGLRLRRGLFLADGNALALSNKRLDPLLDVAQEAFPGRELFGFVDLYSGDRRTVAEWAYLADRGLRRVYVGMETGLDELLDWVNKPGSAEELRHFVSVLKGAGLEVSLIVMVGLGGEGFRHRHRQASREVLCSLSLEPRDQVYLSPFVEHPGSAYHERRVTEGLLPMSADEVEVELGNWASDLRQAGMRVSRYDIREFVY